jgi:hypothetical protein
MPMYRFLDRSVIDLDPAGRLLIHSIRSWVGAYISGRCPCSEVAPGFAQAGARELVPDFNMAMFILNREGLRCAALRPGPVQSDPRRRGDAARAAAIGCGRRARNGAQCRRTSGEAGGRFGFRYGDRKNCCACARAAGR